MYDQCLRRGQAGYVHIRGKMEWELTAAYERTHLLGPVEASNASIELYPFSASHISFLCYNISNYLNKISIHEVSRITASFNGRTILS